MALIRQTVRILRNQTYLLEARIVTNCFTSGQGPTTRKTGGIKDAGSQPPPPPPSKETYKVPEYYGHNEFSFYDYEGIMAKDRIPQPKAKSPEL